MSSTARQQAVTARRADGGDAKQIYRLFQAVYTNSSHPFQSLADVESFLGDDRNFEMIAEDDGSIVAGAAMTYNAWNDSYELGRAITDPDFRRNGLAGVVMKSALEQVCVRELGSVFFGFPRGRRIAELAAELNPAFVAVGHDGGRKLRTAVAKSTSSFMPSRHTLVRRGRPPIVPRDAGVRHDRSEQSEQTAKRRS